MMPVSTTYSARVAQPAPNFSRLSQQATAKGPPQSGPDAGSGGGRHDGAADRHADAVRAALAVVARGGLGDTAGEPAPVREPAAREAASDMPGRVMSLLRRLAGTAAKSGEGTAVTTPPPPAAAPPRQRLNLMV